MHTCTLAARESGKLNYYLVEPWTNNMGNSPDTVKSSVVLRSQKFDGGALHSFNLLVFNISNIQVKHWYSSGLLTIVSHTFQTDARIHRS